MTSHKLTRQAVANITLAARGWDKKTKNERQEQQRRRTLDVVDLVVTARDTKDCSDSRFATLNTKWEKRSRCCISILNTALLHIFLNNHAALLIPTNIDFSTGYYSGDDVCQATIIWYSLSRLPLKINYQSTCHSRALRRLLISYRNLNCKGFIIFSMR